MENVTNEEFKNLLSKYNQLEKNNELFSNSLTLLIVGEKNFCELMKLMGIEQRKIYDYKEFYKKYLKDYRSIIIQKYKIDLTDKKIVL